MKLDEILEFLYGDKHAELVAEKSFVQYAYENYASIMVHEQQRIATIASLQEAKKVAMQNIEFYIEDLGSKVSAEVKDYSELEARIEKCFQIKEGLELSQQLYVMSSILEVYFAQNQDSEYLTKVEKNMQEYIDKCDRRIVGSFNKIEGRFDHFEKSFKIKDRTRLPGLKERVGDLIASLDGGKQPIRQAVHSALYAPVKKTEYYLSGDGNVYMPK